MSHSDLFTVLEEEDEEEDAEVVHYHCFDVTNDSASQIYHGR
jgi:hypothetical protein